MNIWCGEILIGSEVFRAFTTIRIWEIMAFLRLSKDTLKKKAECTENDMDFVYTFFLSTSWLIFTVALVIWHDTDKT